MQAGHVRVQVGVHGDAVAVELQLRRVQQRLIGGEAGHDLVHGLDEVNDVEHGAVRHGRRDVARDSIRQRGADVRLHELLLPGALTVENVAEALHHDVARAEHVRQLANLLRVGDRLVERHGEIVRAEDGHIRVGRLELLIRVAVDDGEVIVVVFLRHEAAWVLAERAHLVLERGRVADELGLIQHAVDGFHDLVAHLDAHADVDRAGLVLHTVLEADLLQPVGAAAAGGDDGVPGLDGVVLVPIVRHDAAAAPVTHDDVLARAAEEHLHAVVAQVVLDTEVDLVRLLGAEVADRAVNQAQARADSARADTLDFLRVLKALNVLIGAKLKINAVGIVDDLLRLPLADERGQVAADIAAQRELAVRERARAGETGRDVAIRLAVHALAGLGLRAAAVFNRLPLLDHDDLFRGAAAQQLQRREDTGRARADNDNICVHEGSSLFCILRSCFLSSGLTKNALLSAAKHSKNTALRAVFLLCVVLNLERATRFELATSTLARWRSAK